MSATKSQYNSVLYLLQHHLSAAIVSLSPFQTLARHAAGFRWGVMGQILASMGVHLDDKFISDFLRFFKCHCGTRVRWLTDWYIQKVILFSKPPIAHQQIMGLQ
jgi:hypothetical protein